MVRWAPYHSLPKGTMFGLDPLLALCIACAIGGLAMALSVLALRILRRHGARWRTRRARMLAKERQFSRFMATKGWGAPD